MVLVRIPGFLQDLASGESQVSVEAGSVAGVIDGLEARFPGIRDGLLDDSGLRRYVNIYVDGRSTRFVEGMQTPVTDASAVWILPTSSGGMAAR